MASVLGPNQSLGVNQSLFSPNQVFELILQADGNLVLYRVAGMRAIWATNTKGKKILRATMQTDGNFVLYGFDGKAVWSTKTNGKASAALYLQDDGNLVIYEPRYMVWNYVTGTLPY